MVGLVRHFERYSGIIGINKKVGKNGNYRHKTLFSF